MRIVYSRNRRPMPNTTEGMEAMGVRDEPARISHVLNEERGDVTICGAPVSRDPVPDGMVLPNCANCFNSLRRQRQGTFRRPVTWRVT